MQRVFPLWHPSCSIPIYHVIYKYRSIPTLSHLIPIPHLIPNPNSRHTLSDNIQLIQFQTNNPIHRCFVPIQPKIIQGRNCKGKKTNRIVHLPQFYVNYDCQPRLNNRARQLNPFKITSDTNGTRQRPPLPIHNSWYVHLFPSPQMFRGDLGKSP